MTMTVMLYIKNHFGSKRGLLNAVICAFKMHSGGFHRYKTIHCKNVKRFIFICSGNICRSPVAEYIAKKNGANAISYGLHCRGGDRADDRAIEYARSLDIDVSAHRTQNIKDYIPQEGDLLVGMEPQHASELEALFGKTVSITLAGLWLPKPQAYIHDPYSTTPEFFNYCEHQVALAVESLVKRIAT